MIHKALLGDRDHRAPGWYPSDRSQSVGLLSPPQQVDEWPRSELGGYATFCRGSRPPRGVQQPLSARRGVGREGEAAKEIKEADPAGLVRPPFLGAPGGHPLTLWPLPPARHCARPGPLMGLRLGQPAFQGGGGGGDVGLSGQPQGFTSVERGGSCRGFGVCGRVGGWVLRVGGRSGPSPPPGQQAAQGKEGKVGTAHLGLAPCKVWGPRLPEHRRPRGQQDVERRRVVPAEGGGGQPLGMGQRMGLAGWVTGTRAEGL